MARQLRVAGGDYERRLSRPHPLAIPKCEWRSAALLRESHASDCGQRDDGRVQCGELRLGVWYRALRVGGWRECERGGLTVLTDRISGVCLREHRDRGRLGHRD